MGRVEDLEALVVIPRSGFEREVKLALSSLLVDLRSRASSSSPASKDFFVGSLRVLRRIKGTANAERRLECLRVCSQFFYSNDLMLEGLSTADEMLSVSRAITNQRWIRTAESIAGVVKADLGNIPDAISHYCNAIDLAKRLKDKVAELTSWVNLGVALNYAGLYREALKCFQSVESYSGTDSSLRPFYSTATSNLAQSYLALGESRKAYDAICRSLSSSCPPSDAQSFLARVIREFTFVRIALELGNEVDAREHATACQSFAARSPTTRGIFHAEAAIALCEIYGGDVSRGLASLERAASQARGSSATYAELISLLVRAYEQAGRPREALDCMRRLITHIRHAREQSINILLGGNTLPGIVEAGEQDLHALQLREADLRARVAEREIFDSQLEMLERLAVTANLKEEISGEHGYRVGKLSSLISQALGASPESAFALEVAARLHDIGKIGIPDRILLTSAELRAEQRNFMSMHTTIGAELLSKSSARQIRLAEDVARFHHERWDGTGYPTGLRGSRIPLQARIVAVADVYDALTHGRPYAEPWSHHDACEDLRRQSGSGFDPEVVSAALTVLQQLRSLGEVDQQLGRDFSNTAFARTRNRIAGLLDDLRERSRESPEYSGGNI